MVNANGARAGTGIDRPDQHAYAIGGKEGEANEVRMVNTGAQGRFNRAQRACFNFDENVAFSLTGSLLTAAVFGRFAAVPSLLNFIGWYIYANGYKGEALGRIGGMMLKEFADWVNY